MKRKKCENCKIGFISKSNRQIYCKKCKKIIHKEISKQCMRNKRKNETQQWYNNLGDLTKEEIRFLIKLEQQKFKNKNTLSKKYELSRQLAILKSDQSIKNKTLRCEQCKYFRNNHCLKKLNWRNCAPKHSCKNCVFYNQNNKKCAFRKHPSFKNCKHYQPLKSSFFEEDKEKRLYPEKEAVKIYPDANDEKNDW